MRLEFHQLDRRHEHLRVRNAQRQRQLLASLATSGQQTPIIVVALSDQPDRYLVIDGYKRIAALEQLGRDTVEAVIWPLNEVRALVLDRTLHWSERESALEAGARVRGTKRSRNWTSAIRPPSVILRLAVGGGSRPECQWCCGSPIGSVVPSSVPQTVVTIGSSTAD